MADYLFSPAGGFNVALAPDFAAFAPLVPSLAPADDPEMAPETASLASLALDF